MLIYNFEETQTFHILFKCQKKIGKYFRNEKKKKPPKVNDREINDKSIQELNLHKM